MFQKTAYLVPIFKEKEQKKVGSYMSLRILNYISRINKKYILESFKRFMDNFLSEFMVVYEENLSSGCVLTG